MTIGKSESSGSWLWPPWRRALPGLRKTRRDGTRHFARTCLPMALLAAGCARFDHQTAATEPHGLVRFEESSDRFMEEPVAEKLDGLGVSAGRDYRVKPGKHELVFRVITPRAGKENRQITLVTNVVLVEDGWRYRVIGDTVKRTKLEE